MEALESYSRRDNLLIAGLPVESYAEEANAGSGGETSQAEEQSVLQLCNEKLGVNISSADMSVAHRLTKRRQTDVSPPVRFTSRIARNAVYAARRHLKNNVTIYISEDL